MGTPGRRIVERYPHRVRITQGTFAGFTGEVVDLRDHIATIVIQLGGRPVYLKVAYEHLEVLD
jgi:hypothetical protein